MGQVLWVETFWDTMQAAWEKLDIHRISKYLLVIRIVVAEAFKAMRIAGWPLEEMRALGKTFTRAMPTRAKEGPNAPSLGLNLQFTRILWDEMRPQLEASPPSKKALLGFLEPYLDIVEGSPIDSLVRHIHQHILRRAPHELLDSIVSHLLESAARKDVTKKNREALYDTADVLEKMARSAPPKGVKPLQLTGGASSPKAPVAPKLLSPLQLPAQLEPQGAEKKKNMKKGKKRKAAKTNGDSSTGDRSQMSPLMLPAAAIPDVDENGPAIRRKRKIKRVKQQGEASADASLGAASRKKKRRKS